MLQLKSKAALVCIATSLLLSCGETSKQNTAQAPAADTTAAAPVENVLTAKDRAGLTPDSIIQSMKLGNERFYSGNTTVKNPSGQIKQAAAGQYPEAIILSCIDSRIPVETVFDRGIGDVFVTRVAGNFVNEDILGSMEFACKVSGAKLIMVVGHENCGAIKSAIDDVKLGNITAMLSKIKPAVVSLKNLAGLKTSKDPAFVHAVCEQNVKLTMQAIRDKSAILKEMEQKGEIKIVGAIYDLDNGHVTFE